MNQSDIKLVKKSFWDYDLKDETITAKLNDLRQGILSDERFFLRILENFSWHFLNRLIPQDTLLQLLTDDIIQKIRSKRRRENLANVKSILLDLPLPFSRWDHLDDERSRHGLLSDRWYGIK